MRTPRAETRYAALFAVLAASATAAILAAGGKGAERPLVASTSPDSWRAVLGARPVIDVGPRVIVVLKTPSLGRARRGRGSARCRAPGGVDEGRALSAAAPPGAARAARRRHSRRHPLHARARRLLGGRSVECRAVARARLERRRRLSGAHCVSGDDLDGNVERGCGRARPAARVRGRRRTRRHRGGGRRARRARETDGRGDRTRRPPAPRSCPSASPGRTFAATS